MSCQARHIRPCLQSEIYRTLRIHVGCTHARTNITRMHFYEVSRKFAKFFSVFFVQGALNIINFGFIFFPIGITCDFEKRQFGLVHPTFILANFKRNALLWSRLVQGWVQQNSNFGSLDCRLIYRRHIHSWNVEAYS